MQKNADINKIKRTLLLKGILSGTICVCTYVPNLTLILPPTSKRTPKKSIQTRAKTIFVSMPSSLKTGEVCYPFYALVITRCLVQNDKYFTSFSYFANLFGFQKLKISFSEIPFQKKPPHASLKIA